MEELKALLKFLKDEDAPANVIKNLEDQITRKGLRIIREDEKIRLWLEKKGKDEEAKKPDALLLFLILLLFDENESDHFYFSDLFTKIEKLSEKDQARKDQAAKEFLGQSRPKM